METERDKWLELNRQWETSGLTQRQFCDKKKLNFSKFTQWRTQLIREKACVAGDTASKAANIEIHDFIPVHLPESKNIENPFPDESESVGKYIDIQLPHGISMRIPVHVAQ